MADEDQPVQAGNVAARDDVLADWLLSVGFGDNIRYDHLSSRWLIWNGVRWERDRTRQVYNKVREYTDKAWTAGDLGDGERRKQLLHLYDTSRKDGVLKSLMARKGIAMTGLEWDQDPYLLGFKNGIMDLRTGEFDSHPQPTTMVSKSVGVDWDPNAPHDVFDGFMQSIFPGDPALIDYVLTVLGYTLFGMQSEQKFWIWVGQGSNGKGILARSICHALGDYATSPADTLYMRTKGGPSSSNVPRPDLLMLQGLRFTYMSEPPGKQFNEELLKAHTGEDLILARDLYAKKDQMAFFAPTHKIVFLTNDPPKTDDVGVSMRRRVRIVHFEQDFTGSKADMTLEDRVRAQRQGILAVLVYAARVWWNSGAPELVEPAQVTAWSDEYMKQNDPLGPFIEECCELGGNVRGPAYALWAAYEDWAAKNGVEAMSSTGFGNALSRRFPKTRIRTGLIYHGIRAKTVLEGDDDE